MAAPSSATLVAPARRFSLRRLLTTLAVGLVVVAVGAYVAVSIYGADTFTHPKRNTVGQCSDYGLVCENVQFTSTVDNTPLSGWYIKGGGKATILMLHGRNGTRDSKAIGMMDIAHGLLDQGYDVLTIDFRGHGLSGGDRYTIGDWERRDVAGALAYLKGRGVQHIGAIGFSMGAGTLLRSTPAHPEMEAVVLDSPFSDLEQIVERHFTENSGLPLLFEPGIVDAAQLIYGIDVPDNKPEQEMARLGSRPLLLIHATGDTYIPVEQAYTLQKIGAADPNFQSWIVAGSEHVKAFKDHSAEYMQRVTGFFKAHLP